jgi:hypothetical protein
VSLDRTALRLATILALTNNDREPYPTMAGAHVFDSEPDPQQLRFDEGERQPIAVVHIDADTQRSQSRQNGGGPWRNNVQILIELRVVQQSRVDGEMIVGLPVTSPEMETALDVFEYQVCGALFAPDRWGALWQLLAGRVGSWESDRFNDPDQSAVRFVERAIAIDCDLTWRAGLIPSRITYPGIAAADVPPPLPAPMQKLIDTVEAARLEAAEPQPMSEFSRYVAMQLDAINAARLPQTLTLPDLLRLRMKTSNEPGDAGVAQVEF